MNIIPIFQFGFPFILSVFVASGIVALALIPFYYLPRARFVLKNSILKMVDKKAMLKGTLLLVSYILFIAFLVIELNISLVGGLIMTVVMVSSVTTVIFEKPITDSMIEYIPVERFEDGDIIATNLMKKSEIISMKKKVNGFDRLVTTKLMNQMRKMRIKEKFPVYRKAMPLALPIFAGAVISLLAGNIVLIVI